ncbi:MAG: family 43 glycosylhydrolase, partial [Sciscionella sp.]
ALLRAGRPDEGGIVEAPTLVERGSEYVLLYSANGYRSGRYFVNYARSNRLAGPYSKAGGALLSRQSSGLANPGGQSVVRGLLGDHLVFHAGVPSGRGMFVARLDWQDGNPVVSF